ncbi:NAD(P)/FAD-dependent oxidoreductase [Albidovulum sediminicola]|uniref:FAD-binding oxidoreductase n=1 Tax=Albidovulum sediminicola TaxID=2984331 RepID=A0ABT2Z044_9RHOB|nr:FAD-binding oxidoreductase [Defluviimonas sp. WL0075]MCV2864477.1 FAD-binding oxidoreductase [Defluviimonas sp. WL0075]
MTATQNLWRMTCGAPLDLAPLAGEVTADVVVVGGGFTGLSAALHLAEAGARVVLLEAETIGHGGSGRNVGLVNAGLWTPPDEVEAALGATEGQCLNAALAAGPDLVFDLIARHGIDCEAVRNGTLHLAHSAAGLRDLQSRRDQQIRRQAPVRLLDAAETAARVGAGRFAGALWDGRAGTIQPLAYAMGLARAAILAGASLHERSPARAIEPAGGQWIVRTDGGTVRARRLIQATNAYASSGASPGPLTPVHYFQLATEPLSAAQRARILPGGEGCWDTATVMTSYRLDRAGRLLLGSVGNLEDFGAAVHRNWARRRIAAVFPALAGIGIEAAWSGRIAMTGDHLPKVAETAPGAISIWGYSGRGISPGTVFGRAAARWALGEGEAFPVTIRPARPETLPGLRALYYETGAVLTHMLPA